MNTMIHSTGKLLVLSVLSLGFTAASVAQTKPVDRAGPRNTIPQIQTPTQAHSVDQLTERLHVSRNEDGSCTATRVVRYGHPGKGLDRIETREVPCDRSRLATK
jgi:hypothetical protein